MKKLTLILLLTITAAFFTGCGGNTLFKGLSLKNTSLLLYKAGDASSFDINYMYQGDDYKNKFLSALSSVTAAPAENWDFSDITFPLYGFYLNDSENREKYFAWSNGYLITQDGKMYKFAFDFEKVLNEYPFTEKNSFTTMSFFPCARQLMLKDGGWNYALMTKAEPVHQYDVGLEFIGMEEGKVTCRFTNHMEDLYVFGEYYLLQVQGEDQTWYTVPAAETLSYHDLAYELSPGQSYDMTYYLAPYGDLPAGRYRILGGGLGNGSYECAAEFDLE